MPENNLRYNSHNNLASLGQFGIRKLGNDDESIPG